MSGFYFHHAAVQSQSSLTRANERIQELYGAWGRPDEALRWGAQSGATGKKKKKT